MTCTPTFAKVQNLYFSFYHLLLHLHLVLRLNVFFILNLFLSYVKCQSKVQWKDGEFKKAFDIWPWCENGGSKYLLSVKPIRCSVLPNRSIFAQDAQKSNLIFIPIENRYFQLRCSVSHLQCQTNLIVLTRIKLNVSKILLGCIKNF